MPIWEKTIFKSGVDMKNISHLSFTHTSTKLASVELFVDKISVRVVRIADTVSAQSTTALTRCPRSKRLR